MHRLLSLALRFTVVLANAASITLEDKELAKRLVGTWITDPGEPGPTVSTVTYNADGTGSEVVRLREQSESAGVRVTTIWSITNGVLCIKSIASTDPQRIPVGINLKDRIISISANKFVFEAFDGYGDSNGKRSTKIRKKDA